MTSDNDRKTGGADSHLRQILTQLAPELTRDERLMVAASHIPARWGPDLVTIVSVAYRHYMESMRAIDNPAAQMAAQQAYIITDVLDHLRHTYRLNDAMEMVADTAAAVRELITPTVRVFRVIRPPQEPGRPVPPAGVFYEPVLPEEKVRPLEVPEAAFRDFPADIIERVDFSRYPDWLAMCNAAGVNYLYRVFAEARGGIDTYGYIGIDGFRGRITQDLQRKYMAAIAFAVSLSVNNHLTMRQLMIDSKTGCYDWKYTKERIIPQEILTAAEKGTPLSLLMIDIDNFKQFNELYGHPFGDYVLERTAALLREVKRSSDVVIRVGGDEFAVLLPSADPASGTEVAERLRAKVSSAAYTTQDGLRVGVSLTLGGATIRPAEIHPDDLALPKLVDDLYMDADTALLEAKAKGKNRCVWYAGQPVKPRPHSKPAPPPAPLGPGARLARWASGTLRLAADKLGTLAE